MMGTHRNVIADACGCKMVFNDEFTECRWVPCRRHKDMGSNEVEARIGEDGIVEMWIL